MVPSPQLPNQWHVALGDIQGAFETSSVGLQLAAHGALPVPQRIHSQPPNNVHDDQYYGQAFFDPDEYRALARKRAAESTYGSPGYSRVERGQRKRGQSSAQQSKTVTPRPDSSASGPLLSSNLVGIQRSQLSGECDPSRGNVSEGENLWWFGQGDDPFGTIPQGLPLAPGYEDGSLP